MSYITPGEKTVEKKICRISGEEFFITDKDLDFYDKISPIFQGKKYSIPAPTLCPDERQKNRLIWRNDRVFYKRKCDKTGKEFVTTYSPDKPFIVYEPKIWWSDDWNPLEFGKKVDLSRTFFEQYRDFMQPIPRIGIDLVNCENSDYCNYCGDDKDCYLDIAGEGNYRCFYNLFTKYSEHCLDNTFVYDSQFLYGSISCYNCRSVKNSIYCKDCSDCQCCFDCIGCQNCLLCSNLRNQQFHIQNKAYTPEEYKKIFASLSWNRIEEKFQLVIQDAIHKYIQDVNSDTVMGDNIEQSKNCFYCFNIKDCEECRYCYDFMEARHCQDMNYSLYHPEWDYHCISSLGLKSCMSCMATHNCRNCYYCDLTNNSQNCFGCISVKHGNQMIFNTPYSVQEYETLCGKIIDHMRSTGEWGEFFPHELSPFGYNETVANEYFPMTEEQVKAKGWNWYTEEEKTFSGTAYIPLPISQYDERVVGFDMATKNINVCLNSIIQCGVTERPFKIIKQELAFYIENSIPIPTKHPDQRHKERMDLRNPRKLYERTCTECKKDIISTYSPERSEKVVCEECYRRLIY